MQIPNIIILDKHKKILKHKPLPLVIGFFDGIHLGHLKLFKKAGKRFNILTFVNVPSKKETIFTPISRIKNLYCLDELPENIFIYEINKKNGIDYFYKIIKQINPSVIIVGDKFKYGQNRTLTIKDLIKKFKVDVVKQNKISSTQIKNDILNGKIYKASKNMFIPYYIQGKVIHGKHNGAKIGFKTANIKINNSLIKPKSGSYLGYTLYNHKKYQSAIFIKNNLLETHLLNDFNDNIYGKEIIVFPWLFTRPINKFKTKNDLKDIVHKKVSEIKQMFKKIK